jgi:hypothetical protein
VEKNTYDGVVLGSGGKMPALAPLKDGAERSQVTPADIMLKGTASRVLFGDPALVVCDAFVPEPFSVAVTPGDGVHRVIATSSGGILTSSLTDTYHNDLSPQAPFNDRALLAIDLPAGWPENSTLRVVAVKARGQSLANRLVGYATERDLGSRRLRVQVDVRADAFQRSAIRVAGATVELEVRGSQ